MIHGTSTDRQSQPTARHAHEERRARHVWYYLDKGVQPVGTRRWLPLGSSFPDALRAYADRVETMKRPPLTVPELLTRWNSGTATDRKAGTLDDIRFSLPNLMRFFGDPPAPLEQVDPIHIRPYLDWRLKAAKEAEQAANTKRAKDGKAPIAIRGDEGKMRANREIAWFSAAWNWARDRGLTKAPNPTVGVRRHKEAGRKMYVEHDELAAIIRHAGEPLREAIELAYLIGQRPGDLWQILESDIRGGCIELEQAKTNANLRIEVTGALAALVDRIKARKATIAGVRSLALNCDERGQPLLKSGLRHRFDRAREAAAQSAPNTAAAERIRAIQCRDLRAKSAIDTEALDKAQKLLGHTTRGMTQA